LEQYAEAFARGHLSLLGIFGHGGLGKSRCVRRILGNAVCWITGNASPFGIYRRAFEFLHQDIVLDDIDRIDLDRNGIRLLKALCQTEKEKTLCWETDAKTLDREGIPRQFTTTSRVVLIANEWRSSNANVSAFEDRGHFIVFEPSPLEVHVQASSWFEDQEVFDFIGNQLHIMERPSLRTYELAWKEKKAGLPWKNLVLSRCLKGVTLEVARLKADLSFAAEKERARAFEEAGWGCRATYFNHAKKLRAKLEVPKITLKRTDHPREQAGHADEARLCVPTATAIRGAWNRLDF
jgi:hypothetical protein